MSSPARVKNQDKDVESQREANNKSRSKEKITQKKEEITQEKEKITRENIERFLYWCNLVLFLVSLGVCVASITITSLRKSAPWGLPLWQWMLLITSLLIGPLLSKLLQEFFRFLVNNKIHRRNTIIIYYIVELLKTTCVILWFGIILLAWIWVMDEPRYLGTPPQRKTTFNHNFLKTFAKIRTTLVTLIIGAFLWLLKDIMLLKAKSSFQMERFKGRVWESILHQEVLNILTQKLPSHDNGNCIKKSTCGESNMPRILDYNLTKDNVSSWWINDAIKWLTRNEKVAYYYDDQDAQSPYPKRNVKFIEKIEDSDEVVECIHDANLEILKDKTMKWAKENGVEDKNLLSKELFGLVDLDTGAIFEKQLVKKIYGHRESIYKALQANKSLFETLNTLIDVLLLIVIIALWLILLNLLSIEVLGLIGGAIAGSAFLIGDTAKNILSSLLFIFSVHPFDIGDWCRIEDTLVEIKDIRVLFTSTWTFDGEERYYSNTALVSQNITNYTRSHDMNDHLVFYPNIEKANEIVVKIKSELEKLNMPTDYFFVKEFLQDQEKLKITLHFKHNISSHEILVRTKKKSELISIINDIIIGEKKQEQTNATDKSKIDQATQQSNEVSEKTSPSK